MQGKEPRLREQVHAVIRVNHYSIRTEKTYWYWVRYFIRFHQMKHPRDMGPREVNEFLTWLAVHRNVAAATQSQALNALVFLYGKVLDKPLGEIGEVITVRDGKGAKDRTTLLPGTLIAGLKRHADNICKAWKQKEREFQHPVSLPHALSRKYPNAGHSLEWQWLFSSPSLSSDNLGNVARHHRHITSVQRAVRSAVKQACIGKPAGCHTFRHTHCVHCLRRWVLEGADLAAYLPILKTYMGHYSFQDTAHYLRLTAELFPDITAKSERAFGDIVPTLGGDGNETN